MRQLYVFLATVICLFQYISLAELAFERERSDRLAKFNALRRSDFPSKGNLKSTKKELIKAGSVRGPFIVRLHRSVRHEDFELFLNTQASVDAEFTRPTHIVTHRFSNVHFGLVIEGFTQRELENMPNVLSVRPVTKRKIMAYSWGLDRINQAYLPLDNEITSDFTGLGVSVYVVDTGLDTNHVEFRASSLNRVVKNIYSAFEPNKQELPADTDGQGHGTHVAATIGGNTVGVSPGANIFGLRVLNENGEGDTSDILAALDFVVQHQQSYQCSNGEASCRGVVSMSLGGPCDFADCSRDSLVQAVEELVGLGIVVSVAAGNEGCNACSGSPNAAPNAINVGAIDSTDTVTYFSNFGQCIDVFAPGMNINSACANTVCADDISYWSLSGTSMACPHVSGVVAQLLEKYPAATPLQVFDYLSCDAVVGVLHMDKRDTITKDLLLQVPKKPVDGSSSTIRGTVRRLDICQPGIGCSSECSDAGVCLPSRLNSTILQCFCDGGHFGADCGLSSDPLCSAAHYTLSVKMQDSYGDGWTFTNFVITDPVTNAVVDGAFDSLCYDAEGTLNYCVQKNQCYLFDVNRGYFPEEVSWSMCGQTGGAPYRMSFCVSAAGVCSMQCDSSTSAKVPLALHDQYGDGWEGGYYAVYDQTTGSQSYGGTLVDGYSVVHNTCLLRGSCSIFLVEHGGDHPSEMTTSICGHTFDATAAVRICIGEDGICSVSSLYTPSECQDNNDIQFLLFAKGSTGWNGAALEVVDSNTNQIKSSVTMENGFESNAHVCLDDGCYDFDAISSTDSTVDKRLFWSACGQRGLVPWKARLCVDYELGLCYGLAGCPFTFSKAHYSDYNYLFVTSGIGAAAVVETFDNVHSANELCGLEDGCYTLSVGGGHLSAVSGAVSGRSHVTVCENYDVPIPSKSTMCISNNGTSCEVKDVVKGSCADAHSVPFVFFKLDSYGDGWGTGAKYVIKAVGSANIIVAQGSLPNGEYGMDSLCLNNNTCYTMTLTGSQYAEEIVWLFCGYVGGAPVHNMRFCVVNSKCQFDDLDDDTWNSPSDDDFVLFTHGPTLAPTSPPTLAPSVRPTEEGSTDTPTSLSPSASPTTYQTPATSSMYETATPTLSPSPPLSELSLISVSYNTTLSLFSLYNSFANVNSEAVLSRDMLFLDFAVRRVLAEAGFNVWSVLSLSSSLLTVTQTNQRTQQVQLDLAINLQISIIGPDSGTPVESVAADVDYVLQTAQNSGSPSSLQVELSYSFDTCAQLQLMNNWIDDLKLSSVSLAALLAPVRILSSIVNASSNPPNDNGYSLVYPNPPSDSNYKDIHKEAIFVIVLFIVLCFILLLSIRYWISHAKKESNSSAQFIIDFDSGSHAIKNPMMHTSTIVGPSIEMSRGSGYGKLQTLELEGEEAFRAEGQASPSSQGNATRNKYARNISNRLLLRNKGSSAYTSLSDTALDVSTRSEGDTIATDADAADKEDSVL